MFGKKTNLGLGGKKQMYVELLTNVWTARTGKSSPVLRVFA